ncbi:MAG: hypothetical protein SVE93_00660 [Candidatus Thermoplasmatota archaeon]|nr:hypothetical protein [Candidatus Thermoplasmatota archaeon]
MQSRKPWMTVLITIALFMAMTFIPKVSAEEPLKTGAVESAEASSMVSEVFSRFTSMIEEIQFILDATSDLIEALLAVTLSEEDAIDLFTTVAMAVELIAGMIFAAILSTFIALIVIVLTLPLAPITGMMWDIFVLVIILYGGFFIGVMATVRLDNATGISGSIGGALSRVYFALTPLWQALYRNAGSIIERLAEICARIPVIGDLSDFFKVVPEEEVPEPPAPPEPA